MGRTTAECHKAVLELWHDTTLAKMPEMLEYIGDLLECDRKFLLFAHHRDVLDAFQEFLEDKVGVLFDYVKEVVFIDGLYRRYNSFASTAARDLRTVSVCVVNFNRSHRCKLHF